MSNPSSTYHKPFTSFTHVLYVSLPPLTMPSSTAPDCTVQRCSDSRPLRLRPSALADG